MHTGSQNQALFALAPRDAFAVEVFEQRNRILAGNARPILECGYGKSRGFAIGQHLAQAFQRRMVEDQIVIDTHEAPFPQQDLQ